MIQYVLDTNVLSEPVRPTPSELLLRRLAARAEACAVPAPVWHELWYGRTRLPEGRRRDALTAYLEQAVKAVFPVLPYDGSAAERHAEDRVALAAAGRTPSFVDGQIAAIAAVHDLVLVTRNVKDFAAWPDLAVEDWFAG